MLQSVQTTDNLEKRKTPMLLRRIDTALGKNLSTTIANIINSRTKYVSIRKQRTRSAQLDARENEIQPGVCKKRNETRKKYAVDFECSTFRQRRPDYTGIFETRRFCLECKFRRSKFSCLFRLSTRTGDFLTAYFPAGRT